MAADLTTIHPFPELRAYAEEEERAFYSLDVSIRGTSLGQWARMDDGIKHIVVTARLALLCDLTRHASRDAVCRLVAQRIAWPAWEVAKAEDTWTTLVALCRKVGVPEPARWEPHPPFSSFLAAIVRHLWPPETP